MQNAYLLFSYAITKCLPTFYLTFLLPNNSVKQSDSNCKCRVIVNCLLIADLQ